MSPHRCCAKTGISQQANSINRWKIFFILFTLKTNNTSHIYRGQKQPFRRENLRKE